MAAYWRATCAVLFAAARTRAAVREPSCGPDEVCGPQDVEAVEEASMDALRVELLQSRGKLMPASTAPMPASTSPKQEFKIVIDNTAGPRSNNLTELATRLGVRLSTEGGVTFEAVETGGLVQQWNENNPESAVEPGDRVVEVNGIRDDLDRIAEECMQNKKLEVVLRRDQQASLETDLGLTEYYDDNSDRRRRSSNDYNDYGRRRRSSYYERRRRSSNYYDDNHDDRRRRSSSYYDDNYGDRRRRSSSYYDDNYGGRSRRSSGYYGD